MRATGARDDNRKRQWTADAWRLGSAQGSMVEAALHLLTVLVPLIRSDPRIGVALVVLLFAGSLAAVLIRRTRRDNFPKIR